MAGASTFKLYTMTAGMGTMAKIIRMGSAFASMWLINHMIGKEEFGLVMIAVTFYYFLSAVVSTGFKNLVLYRVSRMEKTDPLAHLFGSSILWLGGLLALILCALCGFNAELIANQIFGQPDLAFWIKALALYLPFDLTLQVLCFWHRARQDTKTSIVFLDIIPPLCRIGVLLLAAFAGLEKAGIAAAYLSEVILSFTLLYFYKPLPPRLSLKIFTKEDRDYGLKMSMTQLLHQPARSLDILLVGALTSPEITAEYALASRFLTFMVFGKQLVEPLITPRIGSFLHQGKINELQKEYELTRVFSLVSSLMMMLVFVLYGREILGIFGDYDNAYPLLLILSAAVLMRTGTGFNGAFLNMAGYPGYTLITIALAAFVILVPGFFMISAFGAMGAAFAVLAADILSNSLVTYLVWHLKRFPCIRAVDAVTLALSILILILTALGILHPLLCAAYIFTVLMVFTGLYYGQLKMIFLQLKTRFKNTR